jgi:hypothetical protein
MIWVQVAVALPFVAWWVAKDWVKKARRWCRLEGRK